MKIEVFDLKNAQLRYVPDFFNSEEANFYFERLQQEIPWKQDKIKLFGKEHFQPRLSSFFAEQDVNYAYSGLELKPKDFSEEILQIKKSVEKFSRLTFNSCLANLYRDGQDSMGWHSDNEKELGENPVIASVSYGAERIFHLKNKIDKNLKEKISLAHGSLLLMEGATQHNWKHQLPKTKKNIGPRLNLTFRKIY
ncbi:alpha-ketoglutarate-dependent dioxygenase AlkB family protein [Salegentibacter flavus]|uniref:Alkylated DNA repair dioxygenase AlkB n=1 Tax=Salegentibacter flavus TaxID=287099 RepID=A0A1I4Y962_9FLAO|nr:alpha-ketoglutarate-dependent dioxygenase AlkB [Salegentibacter flavus]SFN34273.1 Alkylated DNA repair dioxygenase AlkB [Salegentibacter flavus]